jgi:hypothetical protein
VTVTDSQGAEGTAFFVVTVAADTTPPAVADGQFLYQAAPRRVAVRFSEDVSASLQADDLTVRNLTTGADLPAGAATLSWDAATLTATWTFASLADANYRATLHAAGVSDRSNNAMAQDYVLDFFVLAGDANRDRVVNFADLLALARNYNTSGRAWADGDFTGDGVVNFNDLLTLARSYNKALPAPAPVVAAAPSALPATAASVLREPDKANRVFSTTRVSKPAPASAKPKVAARPKGR